MGKGTSTPDDWLAHFPALQSAASATLDKLANGAQKISAPSGQILFQPGDQCRNFLLVIDGSIRVRKFAPNGREIVLYRVGGGQSCVLTTSCLIEQETYSAEGIAETPVTAVALPRSLFETLLDSCPVFGRFVLMIYSTRITDLMVLVEEIAFRKMDARLADYLRRRSADSPVIHATHSEIAGELGTVREVVSRQLKEFEHKGCCKLKRGAIEIIDGEQLAVLARAL